MIASTTTSVVRDTATFFVEGTSSQFQHVLNLYPEVLKLKAEEKNKKPEELIKLDYWYQNELPKQIKARGKDAHCTHEELVQVMKWKQARGKFYPQLNYLVKVNTPRAVMNETKKAFKKLPNLEQAITALSNLKGVGTTMASALLAAAAPEIAPFMADECLLAIPDIEGIDYTTKEYLNFVSYIQNTAERLTKEGVTWTLHSVELALWTHFVACKLKPELLDNIPVANGSSVDADEADEADENDEADVSHQNGNADKSPVKDNDEEESSDENGAATVKQSTNIDEAVNDTAEYDDVTDDVSSTTMISTADKVALCSANGDHDGISKMGENFANEQTIDNSESATDDSKGYDNERVLVAENSETEKFEHSSPSCKKVKLDNDACFEKVNGGVHDDDDAASSSSSSPISSEGSQQQKRKRTCSSTSADH